MGGCGYLFPVFPVFPVCFCTIHEKRYVKCVLSRIQGVSKKRGTTGNKGTNQSGMSPSISGKSLSERLMIHTQFVVPFVILAFLVRLFASHKSKSILFAHDKNAVELNPASCISRSNTDLMMQIWFLSGLHTLKKWVNVLRFYQLLILKQLLQDIKINW